jgi:hypothetical protein
MRKVYTVSYISMDGVEIVAGVYTTKQKAIEVSQKIQQKPPRNASEDTYESGPIVYEVVVDAQYKSNPKHVSYEPIESDEEDEL